jgi:D-3-phosphoglycerate dehydrogenase
VTTTFGRTGRAPDPRTVTPNRSWATRDLLKRDDTVVTAHRAFLSTTSELSLRRRVAEGVAHVLRTGTPQVSGRVT